MWQLCKYFKEVAIKVFQRSITKTVEKNERKNKMTQQRKTKWKLGTENITEINNGGAQEHNKWPRGNSEFGERTIKIIQSEQQGKNRLEKKWKRL